MFMGICVWFLFFICQGWYYIRLCICWYFTGWSIFSKIFTKDTHSSPVRARYGVSLVGSASDWYSIANPAMMCAIYWRGNQRLNNQIRISITRISITSWHLVKCVPHIAAGWLLTSIVHLPVTCLCRGLQSIPACCLLKSMFMLLPG